jgi:hypothetical protein
MAPAVPGFAQSNATIYPAPNGASLSSDYTLQVDDRSVPVYKVKVAPMDKVRRSSAMDDKERTGDYYDEAAFSYFDIKGKVNVVVTYKEAVTAARLLPASPAVPVTTKGKTVQFALSAARNLTLEVNHRITTTLHIFANPPETAPPAEKDPAVYYLQAGQHAAKDLQMPRGKTILYLAPGLHTIENLTLGDGQTLYVAGGAIVRGVAGPDEPFEMIHSGGTPSNPADKPSLKLYRQPSIMASGSHINIKGRGILDGSLLLRKYLLKIQGTDINMDGIIIQDAGTWTMPIWYSDRVSVTNVKLISYRANTDGIDIVSSREVTVRNCFIRSLDDLVVVKTKLRDSKKAAETDKVGRIVVQGNILWNEVAHALSTGPELEADMNDVTFADDDVIHDFGRTWSLEDYHSGSGTVSNLKFSNIKVDRTGNPYDNGSVSNVIALLIVNSAWRASPDKNLPLGKIRNVSFDDIQATIPGSKMQVQVAGASDTSNIESVSFRNIKVNGAPLSKENSAITVRYATGVTGLP